MKKGIIVFMLVLAFCLSACSKKAPENPNHQTQAGTAAAPETTGETETVSDPGMGTDTEVGETEIKAAETEAEAMQTEETAPTEFDYEAYLAETVQLSYDTICTFLSVPLHDGESYAEIKKHLIEIGCLTEDQKMVFEGFGWGFYWEDDEKDIRYSAEVNGVDDFTISDSPSRNLKIPSEFMNVTEDKTISLFTKDTHLYKTVSGTFFMYEKDKLTMLYAEIEQFLSKQYPELGIRSETDEKSPIGESIYMHPENGEAVCLSNVIDHESNYQFFFSAPVLSDAEQYSYPYGCWTDLSDEEITEALINIISCIPNPGEYLEDYLLRLNQSTGASWTQEDFLDKGELQINYSDSWKAGLSRIHCGKLIPAGERFRFAELDALDYDDFNRIGLNANFEDPQRASTVFANLCEYFEKLYRKEALTLESVDEYLKRHGENSPSDVRDPEICKVLSYGGGLPMMVLEIDEKGRGVLSVTDWYSKYQKQILDSQLVH